MLTQFQDDNQAFQMMQSQWASKLEPLLAVPLVSGQQLTSVQLVSGTNAINHKLDAVIQGWIVVRKRQWLNAGTPTAYDITDTQSLNSSPRSTLQLYCTQGTAANPVVVDLWVY